MRVAILGTRGVPASYSGFETCAEELGARMAAQGHDVTVYCRSHHVRYRESSYRGMRLVKLPGIHSKHLDTMSHTFLAILHAGLRRYDVFLVCGVGNAILLPLITAMGGRTVINVDGSDFKRKKWGRFATRFLRASERWAVRCADEVISDSRVVQRYYEEMYGRETPFIPYGCQRPTAAGKDVLERFGLAERGYLLFVGRLVPENCCHHLTEAFRRLRERNGLKLVVVGDAPYATDYIAALKSTNAPDIVFTGYVFGDGYAQLMSNAYLCVVASEVGGTHPVLVEAMGFGNCVVVNDIETNLETIGEAGVSYHGEGGADSLLPVLESLVESPGRVAELRHLAKQRAMTVYSWDVVTAKYLDVFRRVAQGRQTARM